MSSSGLCVSCNEPLIPPDTKFCSKCGAPQPRPQPCIVCKTLLPGNSPYCSKCGECQSHPKWQEPSVKWCVYCKTQLPPDATYCTKCSKPQMTSSQEPVKSTSCILCKRSLKGTPQNCRFCSAPQDSNELIKRFFKECNQCGRRIFKESIVCIYQNCLALQKTPPSTPARKEVRHPFSQNRPINTTNVTQSHDHSSHPLQLPQDSPKKSLQPTDKPLITKEQMLQKFKSPSPSASPSPLTIEHDGGSTDHKQDCASTSSAKRVSAPQKRSGDDEDETSDQFTPTYRYAEMEHSLILQTPSKDQGETDMTVVLKEGRMCGQNFSIVCTIRTNFRFVDTNNNHFTNDTLLK